MRDDRDGGQREHQGRHEQSADGGELDLARLDLLAQVLRCPADHQPGDEDGDQDVEEHAVQAGADAAEDHLADEHVHERHGAAEAVSASWPPLTEPFEASVVAVAQRAVLAMPKRTSLSAMLPPL